MFQGLHTLGTAIQVQWAATNSKIATAVLIHLLNFVYFRKIPSPTASTINSIEVVATAPFAATFVIIYSIVETAKANHLKPFDYVQHLLEEIPKHMNDKDCSFLEDLLPWSEKLPAGIRKA